MARVHRAACLAFTAVSLPFEFLPLAIALAGKCRERRTVRQVGGSLTAVTRRRSPIASPFSQVRHEARAE